MSHFSTVKTELRQREPLLSALKDLGLILRKDSARYAAIAVRP